MDWIAFQKHFSASRVARYKTARGGNESKAQHDYQDNLLLAEALMPMLNTVEVALRNGIHEQLSRASGRPDWWETWIGNSQFTWQNKEIAKAKAKLQKRKEPATPDKIVAELTFGFWSSLFNSQFNLILWKDLRLVFPSCPKKHRQRHNISTALSQIRDFRNRIFHHEPLLWLNPDVGFQHKVGITTISWLDPQLAQWLANFDRFPGIFHTWNVNKP